MRNRLLWIVMLAVGASASAQTVPIESPEVPRSCPSTLVTLVERDAQGYTPAQQLMNLLSPWGSFAGTIVIPSGMTVVLDVPDTPQAPGYSARWLYVKSCVTIKGSRNGLDPGPLLVATNRNIAGPIFEVVGDDVRIEGLRFRGPMTTDDREGRDWSVHAIGISGGLNVHIDNNSFEFWSVGVTVFRGWPEPVACSDKAPLIAITRNYFNRNAIDQLGYGVGVFRGCATIRGNLFNKNRHAVAATGDNHDEPRTWFGKGYIARYNYVLEGGFTVCDNGFCYWNQHFDVHGEEGDDGYGGEAGEYFQIAWNTIRGEQTYGIDSTRPAFMLRGKPTNRAEFHDNVVVHDNADEAVRIKRAGQQCAEYVNGEWQYSNELCNLDVGPNRYNTTTINELAAGDFDGDGRDDVFLANGTAWWYSSAGLTEWRFLQPSTLRIRDLRFGQFKGDARTDVLFSSGQNWFVSSGGAGVPQLWRTDGSHLLDCAFGDFDGDGVTDALRANGSTWSVSSSAREPWIDVRPYGVRAASVRVGDFTGDGTDDVFWIASNTWHLWDPAENSWTTDHRKPVADIEISSLVVADFDGDERVDLARTDGEGWSWLRGGTNSWAPLRASADQTEYSDIRAAVLGRFSGADRRADAIRYASSRFPSQSRFGFVLWDGASDAFRPWSPLWQEMR